MSPKKWSRALVALAVAAAGVVGAVTTSAPAHAAVTRRSVSVEFTGGVAYRLSGLATGGDVTTDIGPFGAGSGLSGSLTLPGALADPADGSAAASATVSFDLKALFGFLPVYVGNVRVTDRTVGLDVTTLHLFTPVTLNADGGAASASWVSFGGPFPAGYAMRWSIGLTPAAASDPTYAALDAGEATWCQRAQQTLAGLDPAAYPLSAIGATQYRDFSAFANSKASASPLSVTWLARPGSVGATTVTHLLACKTKTADALTSGATTSTSCNVVNQQALDVAWAAMTPAQQATFRTTGTPISVGDDIVETSGTSWVRNFADLTPSAATGGNVLRAHALHISANDPNFALFSSDLRGNQYCTTWTPAWAYAYFTALGLPGGGGVAPPPPPPPPALPGAQFATTVGGDDADVFVPSALAAGEKLPVVLLLEGAAVDKSFYRRFAATVADTGRFAVVVANHRNAAVGYQLYADAAQIPATLDWASAETARSASPLAGHLDPDRLGLLGHSFGGVVAWNAVSGACIPPFCSGGYTRPAALKAVFVQESGNPAGVDNAGPPPIPMGIIQGSLDSRFTPASAQGAYDVIASAPKALITIAGANHYGFADQNNPPGAQADLSFPTLNQLSSIGLYAKWTATFLRAHLYGDAAARTAIYAGPSAPEANVTITARAS